MNRYPLWKYLIIAAVFVWATLYTLPNFFGEAPAVQVSSAKTVVKITAETEKTVAEALKAANLQPELLLRDANSLRARFSDVEAQAKASDIIKKTLNPDPSDEGYTVSLNLTPRTPKWLMDIHALPMYLGLDLRGGIHLMMQVDVQAAVTQKADARVGELRRFLREKDLRPSSVSLKGTDITLEFADSTRAKAAAAALKLQFQEQTFTLEPTASDGSAVLLASYTPEAILKIQENALKQNINTLHNRVNELGVAEPVIQQQGLDRIVVQLAGVQDMARVQQIIGRIATLQTRMVDESIEGRAAEFGQASVPLGSERFLDADKRPVIVTRDVVFTGDNLTDAWVDQDNNGQPAVGVSLDSAGAAAFRQVTGENIGKRMAILLFEKGKGEVITAPVIQARLGDRFVITGRMSTQEAADTALLLRAGSLAAPMEIIEERTIGPSLGAQNVKAGFNSVLWGFVAVAAFMCIYYAVFGMFSAVALAFNLLMLVAALSMMQATLTLPGMAAMALVLGMAIDANVLVNERIREELREGASPQKAITAGYENAWATIFDSNVTSFIAGAALLAFGTGPVRGFAVVHCLGILTSIFSSVFFSRGLVNWWYGGKKKLQSLAIGTVWRPEGADKKSAAADGGDDGHIDTDGTPSLHKA